MDKRRLYELAGMPVPAHVADHSADETKEEHLSKETHVFKEAHDALEKLLDFFRSQESFEKKRNKESEYEEMEHNAEALMTEMRKHLSEY